LLAVWSSMLESRGSVRHFLKNGKHPLLTSVQAGAAWMKDNSPMPGWIPALIILHLICYGLRYLICFGCSLILH